MIEVRRISEGVPLDFEVVVREGEGVTRHHVTMSREMCERLTASKHTPERCLEAAFRFLLDREPKRAYTGQKHRGGFRLREHRPDQDPGKQLEQSLFRNRSAGA
jgi:hypothetical protein